MVTSFIADTYLFVINVINTTDVTLCVRIPNCISLHLGKYQ